MLEWSGNLTFELVLDGSGCWLSTNFLAGDSGLDRGFGFGGGGMASLVATGFGSLRVIQASLFFAFLFTVLPENEVIQFS